jgi:hypothetical protein
MLLMQQTFGISQLETSLTLALTTTAGTQLQLLMWIVTELINPAITTELPCPPQHPLSPSMKDVALTTQDHAGTQLLPSILTPEVGKTETTNVPSPLPPTHPSVILRDKETVVVKFTLTGPHGDSLLSEM